MQTHSSTPIPLLLCFAVVPQVGGQGGYLMADSDIVEEPALQYTASGRPARHAHKQLDDDFVAP
jgi:hypothetical protein